MQKTLLSLCFLSIALPAHAGWLVRPDVAGVEYSAKQDEGHASFDEALKELADSGRIQKLVGLPAQALFADEAFQKELSDGLERDFPREWKEARESSGNMHNPKMQQLWKPFEKTVFATPTITKLNASLAAYRLVISRLDCEKFEFRSTLADPKRRFHGIFGLHVTNLPEDRSSGEGVRSSH